MTISSTTAKVSYAGNGTTTAFVVPFYFLDASHLKVVKRTAAGIETTLTLTTNYSVTGAGVLSGGTVTLLVAPLSGETLVIARNAPLTQIIDYQTNDPFPAETHEQALDKLTMLVQQLQEQLDRAVKVAITDTTNPDALVTSVANSAASASSSAASAASSLATFQGVYYGSYTADPTTDPLGNAITAGDLYYNTATSKLRIYTGSAWADTATATPVSYNTQSFSGNGSTTSFTLSSAPAALNATEVFISGVRQVPTTIYTLSGSTLTFTTAPASGTNNIYVRWTNSITVGVPNDGSVTAAKMAAGAAVGNIGYTPANDSLAAHLAGAETFTAAKRGVVVSLTDGATITPDFAAGNNFAVTLAGNRTLANPTNQTAGQSGVIVVTQDATGSRTLAYGANWKFASGTAPTLTTTASAVDVIAYYVESATRITARWIGDVK
jgi:hypothetical protein